MHLKLSGIVNIPSREYQHSRVTPKCHSQLFRSLYSQIDSIVFNRGDS